MRPSVFQTLSFLVLAVVFAGSCSDTVTAPGQLGDASELLDGAGNAEVPQAPDAEPDIQEEAEYQTCDEAADCDSTWCVLTQDGSVCTEPCIENCPKGYKCKSTVSGGSDPISLCLPAYLSLCFPCTEDTDCSNIPGALIPYEGAKCISQGADGGFCGGACDSDDACPTDFSCKEIQVGESETDTAMQCVPDSGTCNCSPLAESLGATGQCYVDNEMGRCFGGVTCKEGELTSCDAVPAFDEICDGLDNDCDEDTDEGLEAPVSTKQGGICLDSKQVCDGVNGWVDPNYGELTDFEATEVTCDGKDNDCDGTVDNGLEAPAADNQLGVCAGAIKVCIGGAGWGEPNYGVIENYETNETICDGLDNDCDGQIDEGLTGEPEADNQNGVCAGSVKVCGGIDGWVEPDYTILAGYLADENNCDDLDNDCDGDTDEGFEPGGSVSFENSDGALLGKSDACGSGQCANGTVVCGEDKQSLICTSSGLASAEVCDGVDNDCDPSTIDGVEDPSLGADCDGDDIDLCKEGAFTCEGGALTCNDTENDNLDVCDGADNDCNPATFDGSQDPKFNAACDGTDADLCKEGIFLCSSGSLLCNDANDADPDVCDGQDNDCNPDTVDGSGDSQLGAACDGDDADLCNEGVQLCINGKLDCNDPNDVDVDVCDAADNDCNPATADGSQDPQLGSACDGDDADLCNEGIKVCTNGTLTCNDPNDSDPDLCDGTDNDCNPVTPDGSGDSQLGDDCDGNDADLCNEGNKVCTNGKLVCNDSNDVDKDICDGADNDCNPATADGSGDPQLGDACDGNDADLCKEGNKVCTGGTLSCNDPNDVDLELCGGGDQDCNPATADGSQDPQLGVACDGNDADLCNEGTKVCTGGSLTCNDPNDVDKDVCDGADNDCNPATSDGSQDPQLGVACDGTDADNCKEGTKVCTGGALTCNDPNDLDKEICDGLDNDCKPSTADGSQDPQLNQSCDGIDADLCNEGKKVCNGGVLSCNDPNDLDKEICDGKDNDCNPATSDGSQDPQLNQNCDGIDADACKEGTKVCTGGTLSCTDPNDLDLDVCDGQDNDCRASTIDGSQDPQLNQDCDGSDADLCNEGKKVCTNGSLKCNDPNDSDPDICDGINNDCNPNTNDGSGDPQLGVPCDGNDADACKEGVKLCVGGSLSCNDPNDLNKEVCDGVDNDCKASTADGSQDPQKGTPCDGSDADLCNEGTKYCSGGLLKCNDPNDVDLDLCDGGTNNDCNTSTIDGSQAVSSWSASCSGATAKKVSVAKVSSQVVATGGFNRTTPVDWIRFDFSSPSTSTPFQRELKLTGTGYAMAIHYNCTTAYNKCGSGTSGTTASTVKTWNVNFTYLKGGTPTGCCSDGITRPNVVYVKVFRTSLSSSCLNYTITAKNTW